MKKKPIRKGWLLFFMALGEYHEIVGK